MNFETEKALQAQSDNQFIGLLKECPVHRAFWRDGDNIAIEMDKFDASTIKPWIFTSIFTGSIGTYIRGDDLPPLFDGMYQSRIHGLSFSPGFETLL